jgi:hypothetical protein
MLKPNDTILEILADVRLASVRRTEAVKGSKALRSMITAESEIFALFSDYRDVAVPPGMINLAD